MMALWLIGGLALFLGVLLYAAGYRDGRRDEANRFLKERGWWEQEKYKYEDPL